MLSRLNLKISGSGVYLPEQIVTSNELDLKHGFEAGTCEDLTGVRERRYVKSHESVPYMGAQALQSALQKANLKFSDIDLLVCAGATKHQIIPCNAAFVQKQLGEQNSGVPCFDLDATCLSFMVALDQLSCSIVAGRYKRVAIVTSEIASGHLTANDPKTLALFGDGAVAFIIEAADEKAEMGILASKFQTYSNGIDFCSIKGGGQNLSAHAYTKEIHNEFCFQMDGSRIFKQSSVILPSFVDNLLKSCSLTTNEIAYFVLHQASEGALRIIQKKLNIPDEKMIKILKTHGNQISASIPTALHYTLTERAKQNDKLLLLGTGAGLGVGGMIIKI